MSRRVVLFAVALLSVARPGAAEPVRIAGGLVEGVPAADRAVTVFRGIPFAAPPVGDLRWRAPRPPAPWTGVRTADRFSPACMHNAPRTLGPWTEEFMHQGERSEDCLYLNVWTTGTSGKRPVYVWIYGGGFDQGSSAVALYDGEVLARKGVVVVTFNYRVREFGFLAHPALTKESEAGASGNYGFQDQVAALKWVQANIAAFGGDPARVTIGGQSAGAASVMAMTVSPLSKGLFHQAILQSGVSVGNRFRPRAEAEAAGEAFMTAKGARTLEEMRALPAEQIMVPVEGMSFRAGPIVDGWVLPEAPGDVYARGGQHDVATLTGWTADEGMGIVQRTPAEYRKDVTTRIVESVGGPGPSADRLVEEFFALYPSATDEQVTEAQKQFARDQSVVSTFLWATRRARVSKTPTYTYLWTHALPGPNSATLKAFHSSELAYVFDSLDRVQRPWTAEDRAIAERMCSYWANFVRTGDPNGAGLPRWPAFDASRPVTMELGDAFAPRPIAEPAKAKLIEAILTSGRSGRR